MDRAAGNSTLSSQVALLRRQAVLFWGQTIDGRSSLSTVLEDFTRAFTALEKKDTEMCVQALRDHVLDHIERIQSFMNPDSAAKDAERSPSRRVVTHT
jgi:DNA-binding GntR family transcriptional regulator